MKTIPLILSLILTLFAMDNCDKHDVKQEFTAEELRRDFDVFRTSLEEGHPDLYRYSSKARLDSIFDSSRKTINVGMTAMSFMLLVSKVAAQIGDGHLRISPAKPKKDSLDGGKDAIPIRVYWNNEKLYVWRNYSSLDDKDILGAELITINGKKVADIVNEYLTISTSDGSNVTGKYFMLSRPRPFVRCLNYLYGYVESYEIEYILPGEVNTRKATLPGVTFDEFFKIGEKRYPPQKMVDFSLHPEDQYAYLRISSFDKEVLKENKVDFEKFLKESFTAIAKSNIPNLIVDLRANGGGTDEYGKILFSYFTDQPFKYYESLRMNKETYDFFKYTKYPGRKAPKGMLKARAEGNYDVVKHPNVGIQMPGSPAFKGNVFALINGGCFSTTAEFASMLHHRTEAVFIGEESGGGYYGNCSGATPEFFLPHTKISIEVPLISYTMAVAGYPQRDRGLIPNHTIVPTISDRLERRDVELDFAKNIIRQKK